MNKLHSAALTLLLAMHLSVPLVCAEDAGRLESNIVSSFGETQDIDALLAVNNRFVNGFIHRREGPVHLWYPASMAGPWQGSTTPVGDVRSGLVGGLCQKN